MKSTTKEGDEGKPPVSCFVRTVVYRPCLVCFLSAFIALVLVGLAGTSAAFKIAASWVDYGDKTTKQVFAFQKANAEVREAMQSEASRVNAQLVNRLVVAVYDCRGGCKTCILICPLCLLGYDLCLL